MNGNGCKEIEKNGESFNILSFERKLAELVEELRMKRNLEKENEKNLESVLDEKYRAELSFDEQKRDFSREKEYLEQQIDILKRKLEDKFCVSDDKDKLQIMNKTYSHEIRVLKEELRTTKYEILTLQKNLQEAEGKLNLHKKFQASIMAQVSEVQVTAKSLGQELQELKASQNIVMENISKTKELLQKYSINNQHLENVLSITKQQIETLKRDLIAQKTEMIIMKNKMKEKINKDVDNKEIERMQQRVFEVDQLLLISRRENEKTLSNFLESNKLLSQFMDRYSELQQKEKTALAELDYLRRTLEQAEANVQRYQTELRELQKKNHEKATDSVMTQTEESLCDENHHQIQTAVDFVEAARNDLAELQKSAVILQSEAPKEAEDKKDRNG